MTGGLSPCPIRGVVARFAAANGPGRATCGAEAVRLSPTRVAATSPTLWRCRGGTRFGASGALTPAWRSSLLLRGRDAPAPPRARGGAGTAAADGAERGPGPDGRDPARWRRAGRGHRKCEHRPGFGGPLGGRAGREARRCTGAGGGARAGREGAAGGDGSGDEREG